MCIYDGYSFLCNKVGLILLICHLALSEGREVKWFNDIERGEWALVAKILNRSLEVFRIHIY